MSTATPTQGWTARALGVGLSLVLVAGVTVAFREGPLARPAAGAAPTVAVLQSASSPVALASSADRTTSLGRSRASAQHATGAGRAAGNSAATARQPAYAASQTRAHAAPAPTPTLSQPTYPARGMQAPYRDVSRVPSVTELATLPHSLPGYSSPTTRRKSEIVPGSWYGRVSVLPIVAVSGNRIKVRTAQRPNEHEVWINKNSRIYRSATTYAIVVDLRLRHLFLFNHGRQIGAFPVGIGLRQTPTPTGTYFVAFHAPPNGPGYGSVMLETSAHSTHFRTFEGGTDAIIAIHGPITAQSNAQIGKHGTRISNGCIRMHDNNLKKVGKVPDGTPVIFVG